MTEWHLITCEYPPQVGGVSDYGEQLSAALRQSGDAVHVWAPGNSGTADTNLHRALGTFDSKSLAVCDQLLNQYASPRVLLLQWVPHGYGQRSMNLGFCRWLERRVRIHGDALQIMVHEPFLEFRGLRQSVAAAVHRLMVKTLLGAADRVWLSIPAWKPMLHPFAPADLQMEWLPIPSTIPNCSSREEARLLHEKFASGALLIGHLGTYSQSIRSMLDPIVTEILKRYSTQRFLLLGSGGEELRAELIANNPDLSGRLFATGHLSREALSAHLAACDLLIQPYPDGASSRRTSLMAGIAHGIPVVTTLGHLSEPLWLETAAVAMAPAADVMALTKLACNLIESTEQREQLAEAGLRLYRERFDFEHVVTALRNSRPCFASLSAHQLR
ncbi:MAG TPA: glycosyltransferase family 4 protein [Terriglobales bacterium]|nr:glycosyltransferase family 4 protein [Terriglobales bacterium]